MRWAVAVGHKHTEEKERESRRSCRYKRKTPRPPNRGVGADRTIPLTPLYSNVGFGGIGVYWGFQVYPA
jgi:hypothetical protein